MCTGEVYQCKLSIRRSCPLASTFERNIGNHVFHCWYCGKGKRSGVDSWKTVHPSAKVTPRKDKSVGCPPEDGKSRHRRTFPVTRRLGTNRVPFCTLKRRFFPEIRPLNGNFSGIWNHVSRDAAWTCVRVKFGGNRSKESGRSGVWFMSQKCLCDPFFRALSEIRSAISLETRKA